MVREALHINDRHIELIHRLFSAADQIILPLWLQGGWAIDYFVAPVGKRFSGIIFTTSKNFHRVSGDLRIFRVLRLPKHSLVKLQHNFYMNNVNANSVSDAYEFARLTD